MALFVPDAAVANFHLLKGAGFFSAANAVIKPP
jgi:hypothetical protein